MADHFVLNCTKVTIQRDSWIYIKSILSSPRQHLTFLNKTMTSTYPQVTFPCVKNWHILQFHSLTLSYLSIGQFACISLTMWLPEQNKFQTVWSVTTKMGLWHPYCKFYSSGLAPQYGICFWGNDIKLLFHFEFIVKVSGPSYLMCCQAGLFNTIFLFLDLYEDVFIVFFCTKINPQK